MHGESVTAVAQRGCPQGGVLSPLIWNLVMNGLLGKLRRQVPSLLIQGFADDLVIAQECQAPEIVSERLKQGLLIAGRWCSSNGLKLNPSKTEVVVFTRKHGIKVSPILIDGKQLNVVDKARYLGAIIDSNLC